MFKNLQLALIGYADNSIKWARVNLKMKGFGGQKASRRKENTGKLGKGLGYTIKAEKDSLKVSFTSKENYGYNVEYGRRAGTMPPAKAINIWLTQKKGIKGVRDKNGRFLKRKSSIFLIQRKIKLKGIKAVPFMGVAATEELKKADEIFKLETGLADDVAETIVFNANQSKSVKAKIVK